MELCGKAAHDIFYDICLPLSSFFEGKLSGLVEFYMGLSKLSLECDPRFLDRSETIPGLDGITKFYGRVKDVVDLGDCLRL